MKEGQKEFLPNRESGEQKPTVKLFLFRHAQKESREHNAAAEVPLSDLGREESHKLGLRTRANPEVAVGYGSSRVRTQETAGQVILANLSEINEDTTLAEMEKVVNQYLNKGKEKGPQKKKVGIDPRLDFKFKGEMSGQAKKAIEQGRYLKWIVEQSDSVASKSSDPEALGFSKLAGNVAKIMQKYGKVARNWERLRQEKPEKYQDVSNQLERYLASHGGVLESFLVKVIKLAGSEQDLLEFEEQYPNGFSELEGFRVEIERDSEQNIFQISYQIGGEQKELKIIGEILEKIIAEAQDND